MKLLTLSLLVVLAFAAGILFYRAAFETPAPAVTPAHDAAAHDESTWTNRIILAKSANSGEPAALEVVAVDGQSEPGLEFNVTTPKQADILIPYVTSFDVQVADPQPEAFDIEIADGSAEPGFDLQDEPPQNPTQFDAEIAEPTEPPATTIEAVPDGSRVRIENGETALEADSLSLSADAKPQASAGSGTTQESNPDNPIPEFLRGQQLPPLIPGQKIVTIQVPVDNWVDLNWGDIVRVERELHGVGVGSDANVSGTINLTSLERVAIYALPQFAPEKADTVAVCLKVDAQQARQLLQYRRAAGTFKLTVVQKFEPTPVYDYDDLPVPNRQPGPVPNVSTNSEPTQLPTYEDAATPADTPVYGRTSDFDPDPKTYAEPESHPSSNDFAPPESSRNPLDVPVPADESSPRPVDDFDPNPVAQSQPQPSSSPDDILDLTFTGEPVPVREPPAPADSLPTIEPSDVGTVHRVEREGRYVVDVGQPLLLEAPAGLSFDRVSGFDARLIRVTAESGHRLRIDGLQAGETAMFLQIGKGVMRPFNIQIQVNQPGPVYSESMLGEEIKRHTEKAEAQRRDEAEETLHSLYPEADLQLFWVQNSIVLRGTVASEDEAMQITQIAEQYAPKVHNQLLVLGTATNGIEAPPSLMLPEGTSQSSGIQIPPDMRVVVVTNADVRQVRSRTPGTRVDVYRIRVVPRGKVPSEVYYEPFIEDIALLGTHVRFASAALLVTEKQATALEESFDKMLSWHVVPHGIQPVNGSIPIDAAGAPVFDRKYEELEPGETQAPQTYGPPTYTPRSHNEYWPQPVETRGSTREPGPADDNDSNTSLRTDIRALHDDVRKLIALLEQRVSDSDVRDVEDFEPPLNPSTGSADDAPSEAEPAEDAPVPESGDEGESVPDESVSEFQQRLWDEVGLRVTPMQGNNPRLKGQPYRGGLFIDDVRPGSPFAHAGARTGDVLVGLHVWETTSDESLQFVLNHRDAGHPSLKFYLLRNGETLFGNVSLDRDKPDPTSESSDDSNQKPRAVAVDFAIPLYEAGAPAAVVPVSRALSAFDAVDGGRTFSFHVGFAR